MCDTRICRNCNIEKDIVTYPYALYKGNKCYQYVCYSCKAKKHRNANKRYQKDGVDNLDDFYVKRCIINGNSLLKTTDIPQELVEIKRKQLKLKKDAKKAKENNRE